MWSWRYPVIRDVVSTLWVVDTYIDDHSFLKDSIP